MTRKRLLLLLFILAAALTLPGCFGGSDGNGGRSRVASRGRLTIGRGRNTAARAGSREQRAIDDYSPEGSMERDLLALREREKVQERKVSELRSGLDQGNTLVRQEQEKLDEIRQRIDSYDTAIQRYEMAAESRPPREIAGEPLAIPARDDEYGPGGYSSAVYRDDDPLPESPFAAPAPTRETRTQPRTRTLSSVEAPPAYSDLPVREYRSDPAAAAASDYEYETVIYAPPVVEAPQPRDARAAAAPGTVVPIPPRRKTASGGSGRAATPQETNAADTAWEAPDNLFSRKAAPAVPGYPSERLAADARTADAKLDQAVRDQAAAQNSRVSTMAAPAAAKAQAPLPRTEFRRTDAPAAAAGQGGSPAESAPSFTDDDVFTPDLFLSGG